MDRIYSAEQIRVPPALPGILKAFNKEVIRANPDNLVIFARDYFTALQQGEAPLVQFLFPDGNPPPTWTNPASLAAPVKDIKPVPKVVEEVKAKAEPVNAEPVKAEPVKAEPVKAEPKAEPVKEPTKNEDKLSFAGAAAVVDAVTSPDEPKEEEKEEKKEAAPAQEEKLSFAGAAAVVDAVTSPDEPKEEEKMSFAGAAAVVDAVTSPDEPKEEAKLSFAGAAAVVDAVTSPDEPKKEAKLSFAGAAAVVDAVTSPDEPKEEAKLSFAGAAAVVDAVTSPDEPAEEKKEADAAPAAATKDAAAAAAAADAQKAASTKEFPTFSEANHSLLKKFLTKEMFDELKDKTSKSGFTLAQAIQSGVDHESSGIGVYAGDEDSYTTFAPLFDAIIQDYHGHGKDGKHVSDFDIAKLNAPETDEKSDFIVSTRIRVGRNLAAFPLGPGVSKEERDEIESQVAKALKTFDGDLEGTYYPLKGMSEEVATQLRNDHFLFKGGDRFLESAGLNRDWPDGRGIYHNNEKTFLVWVNEEDQLRIISMQKGGDIKAVFERLGKAVKHIEAECKFGFNDHLGYITSCPTNLGTAMRASVHIKLPLLSKDMDAFKAITDKHHLQIRGIHGEHTEDDSGIFDISNKRRLGYPEVELVQGMYDGVQELIAAETALRQ